MGYTFYDFKKYSLCKKKKNDFDITHWVNFTIKKLYKYNFLECCSL